jgi:hypothetical protein
MRAVLSLVLVRLGSLKKKKYIYKLPLLANKAEGSLTELSTHWEPHLGAKFRQDGATCPIILGHWAIGPLGHWATGPAVVAGLKPATLG